MKEKIAASRKYQANRENSSNIHISLAPFLLSSQITGDLGHLTESLNRTYYFDLLMATHRKNTFIFKKSKNLETYFTSNYKTLQKSKGNY